jgi:hypothetical protein
VRRTIASPFAEGSWLATFCVGLALVIIVNLVPNGCRATLRREEMDSTS